MREGEREEGRGLPLDFAAVPTHADADVDVDVEKTVAFFFLPRSRSFHLPRFAPLSFSRSSLNT